MKIRVLINGAQGKMGKITAATLSAHPDFSVVGETGRLDDLKIAIQESNAQIVVDFTEAKAAFQNTQVILAAGAHPVIGTSGLTLEQIRQLQEQSKQLQRGGIIAPNFSLGSILLLQTAQKIKSYFPQVEIIEMHHDKKKDSPSGTALRTAEILSNVNATPALLAQQETLPHARGATFNNIPIHSIRLPGLLAHEMIIFGGQGETLTIQHDTVDRSCYMPGVILACQKCLSLQELVYGLESLI